MKMSETDLQLLARYARERAEEAFAEVVRRHVDLVHSAALRQVRSLELADEVAQTVFIELAQQARQLSSGTVLAAWLYQVTRCRAIDAVRREANRRLREQTAQELQGMNISADDWTHVEPLLDDAMATLNETDRMAVLLRYFQNKPLREVGQALGMTDDAAQKRVSRAVERLREFFVRRGITIGASSLVAVISANAVQAVPVGLASLFSTTAAGAAGTTVFAAATINTLKLAIMSKLKIGVVSALIVAGVATPLILEQGSVARLRRENLALQEQIRQANLLRGENEKLSSQLSDARKDQSLTKAQLKELLRLRGEVGPLRRESQELARQRASQPAAAPASPAPRDFLPAAAWANVGSDSPEAAIQTFFWAAKHGETNLVGNLLRWQRDAAIPASDELDDEFAKGMVGGAARFAGELQGYRISSQQEDGSEVGLEVTNQDGKTESHTLRFVREDNQWFPVMHVWLQGQGSIRAALDVPPKFQEPK
jgi:RNA polymerase sigma factor (sigma-70 family)